MKHYKVKTLKSSEYEIEMDSSSFYVDDLPIKLTEKQRLEKAEYDAKIEEDILFHSS